MDRLSRTAIVLHSGFDDERQMVDAFAPLVDNICRELLANPAISDAMRQGVSGARHDFPIGVTALKGAIDRLPFSDSEQRAQIMFVLAKTMDDLLSLGAAAAGSQSENYDQFSFMSRKGGQKSGHVRKQNAETGWKASARKVIAEANRRFPSYGVEALARHAIEKGAVMKSESSIKTLIREMVADGLIALRTKEKRQRTA